MPVPFNSKPHLDRYAIISEEEREARKVSSVEHSTLICRCAGSLFFVFLLLCKRGMLLFFFCVWHQKNFGEIRCRLFVVRLLAERGLVLVLGRERGCCDGTTAVH